MDQFRKRYLDIPYTESDNDRQQLDIVFPPFGNPPYKVIVALHGGGWSSGDRKSASLRNIQMAAQQGYVVVNVGYRLSDQAKWPAQLYDVKAAIRYIRANAKQYRFDTRNIVVWGIQPEDIWRVCSLQPMGWKRWRIFQWAILKLPLRYKELYPGTEFQTLQPFQMPVSILQTGLWGSMFEKNR